MSAAISSGRYLTILNGDPATLSVLEIVYVDYASQRRVLKIVGALVCRLDRRDA